MFNPFVSRSLKERSGHILLVEDDRIIAATEVRLLKKLGYAVTLATSGREAVDLVKSGSENLDIILMDIDLGQGIDGTVTAGEIQAFCDIPVLFLSGISDPETIRRIDDVFSYGFVVKGSDITILDASIKMAFRLHRANIELKNKERELLLLSNSFDSSGNAIAISGPDAVLRYVNPAFLKMWGYTVKDEVLGRSISEFWKEPEHASFVARSLLMKDGWTGELAAKGGDGSTFTVDVSTSLVKDVMNRPAGIIATFRSNTARKLADESVMENEERFRSLFENALEGIFQTTPDGRYLNMNPAFASMFGYDSPEEMIVSITDIGKQIYVDPQARERLKSLLQQTELVKDYEAEVYRKDGTKFWISINARLIRGEDSGLDRYEGTNIDITERKLAGERLAEQQEKLLQTNRQLELLNSELLSSYREKDLLLKEINHRIRNNLNMISGILLLEAEKLEDEKYRSFFNDVRARINSMSTVYDRLYQSPDLENINLAEYVRSLTMSIFTSYKPADSRINIHVDADDIRLDVKRAGVLGLILNELVSNAIKHGFIIDKTGKVNVRLKESEGIITLDVSDDGSGISKTKNQSVSTGLPLVKMLAMQAGGVFEISSDQGTTASVHFRR